MKMPLEMVYKTLNQLEPMSREELDRLSMEAFTAL